MTNDREAPGFQSPSYVSDLSVGELHGPPTAKELAILREGMAQWEAEQSRRAELEGKRLPVSVAGTRRFDLATFLLATTVFAVLVTAVRLAGLPQLMIMHLVALVPLVGIGQALLFQGRRPRTAAALAGAGYTLVVSLISLPSPLVNAGDWPTLIFGVIMTGASFGMMIGALVNGVFLALAVVRRPRLSPDELPSEQRRASESIPLRAMQSEN